MYQQVLQPMEHTYGDYMSIDKNMHISYLVISKDVARNSKAAPIIINPFIKIEAENLPQHLDFSISFSFIIDNEILENVVIEILNPEGIAIDSSDITDIHFNDPKLFDETGKRRGVALVGEVGLNSNTGISLETHGKYNIHVKLNGEIKSETFFIVAPKEGETI